MLRIKSVIPKTIYEVIIEYDNGDGKGIHTTSTQVEKLSSGNFSSISYEDGFIIRGTYRTEERFSKAVNSFLQQK